VRHEPAILQGARRVRHLKLIALFKIGTALLRLLCSALHSTALRCGATQRVACLFLLHQFSLSLSDQAAANPPLV
jgi:hypothetical protein